MTEHIPTWSTWITVSYPLWPLVAAFTAWSLLCAIVGWMVGSRQSGTLTRVRIIHVPDRRLTPDRDEIPEPQSPHPSERASPTS
jgi:hypothetical protein